MTPNLLLLVASAVVPIQGSAPISGLNELLQTDIAVGTQEVGKPECLIDVILENPKSSTRLDTTYGIVGQLITDKLVVAKNHEAKITAINLALSDLDVIAQHKVVKDINFLHLAEIARFSQVNYSLSGSAVEVDYSAGTEKISYIGSCHFRLKISDLKVFHSYKWSSLQAKLILEKMQSDQVVETWSEKPNYQIILSDRLLSASAGRAYALDVASSLLREYLISFAINKVRPRIRAAKAGALLPLQ